MGKHAPRGAKLFFGLLRDGVVLFSSSSQWILNIFSSSTLFPTMFPIAPHSPISFALSSTLVTYISNSNKEITMYIFWDCLKLDFFLWCPTMGFFFTIYNHLPTSHWTLRFHIVFLGEILLEIDRSKNDENIMSPSVPLLGFQHCHLNHWIGLFDCHIQQWM